MLKARLKNSFPPDIPQNTHYVKLGLSISNVQSSYVQRNQHFPKVNMALQITKAMPDPILTIYTSFKRNCLVHKITFK